MNALPRELPSPGPDEDGWLRSEVLPVVHSLENFLRGRFPIVRDPEDIVQESLLRVVRARRAGTLRCAKAFLFQTAHNLAIDRIRRFGRARYETAMAALGWACTEESPSPPEVLSRRDELESLEEAVATIPRRAQATFRVYYLEQRTQRETAAALGICESSVHHHLVKGRRHCTEFLRSKGVLTLARDAELEAMAG